MIILHIAPINTTVVNGFRFSVPGLIAAQNDIPKVQVALLNIEDSKKFSINELEVQNIKIFEKVRRVDKLPEPFNSPDIVIFHGVYKVEYINLSKELTKKNIPYIIVPRVSLTKGAQNQKRVKKLISNILLFSSFVKKSSSVQYLTMNEKNLSNRFEQQSFILGNGINIPNLASQSKNDDDIVITFIGRYDIVHKGLDVLMSSIILIKDILVNKNVKVQLYGSDFKNGKQYIQNILKQKAISEIVSVNEPVYGIDKAHVFKETDIFISTSRFEGHPMAVIEAMSYGIPCILTDGTNMIDILEEYNAGWRADFDINDIGDVIIKAIENKDDLNLRGKNARRLAEDNYSWKKIAESSINEYSKIISRLKAGE